MSNVQQVTPEQMKSNLIDRFNKIIPEMVANENLLCTEQNMPLKRIMELSKRNLELGQVYGYLSNIMNTRFPQPHQQPQELKKGLIIPPAGGLEVVK